MGEYIGRTFLSANGKPQGTVRLVESNRGGTQQMTRDAAA